LSWQEAQEQSTPPHNAHSKGGFAKKHKAKAAKAKDIAHVKCYNCAKKGHFARDSLESKNYFFPLTLLNSMFTPMHMLLTLFLKGL